MGSNVIYIKDKNGYHTLTAGENDDEKVLAWGKKYNVDLSGYLD